MKVHHSMNVIVSSMREGYKEKQPEREKERGQGNYKRKAVWKRVEERGNEPKETDDRADSYRGSLGTGFGPISAFVGTRIGVNVPKMQCIHASSSLCVRHNARLHCDSAIIVTARPALFSVRRSNLRAHHNTAETHTGETAGERNSAFPSPV